MTPSRVEVYAALLTHLRTRLVTVPVGLPFRTVEDGVRDWANVRAEEMPYLGITAGGETPVYQNATQGTPKAWHLKPVGWLYLRTKDDRGRPQALLADALDAIDDAMVPPVGFEFLTLGGLIHTARFAGTTETDEGSLGELAAARVGFELLVESD